MPGGHLFDSSDTESSSDEDENVQKQDQAGASTGPMLPSRNPAEIVLDSGVAQMNSYL